MEFPPTTSSGSQDDVGEDFSTKGDGDRTALILSHACRNYHMHVGTITFYLSLTPCGQLGSSNQSALFIATNNLSLTRSLLILVSLRMTQLYLFLSYVCSATWDHVVS